MQPIKTASRLAKAQHASWAYIACDRGNFDIVKGELVQLDG